MSGVMRPARQNNQATEPGPYGADPDVLASVDRALALGVALKRWSEYAERGGGYAERFDLIRAFNPADTSYGFFDRAQVGNWDLPVMGTVERVLYDQGKGTNPTRVCEELREFVLRYFMRIAAFQEPQARPDARPAPAQVSNSLLNWCPDEEIRRGGFGFSQLYYRRHGSGSCGQFPPQERSAIVDLRDIGPTYDWVVLRARIYDFNLTFRTGGQDMPQLVWPLREEPYLVVSPDFILDEEAPAAGVLGRYGFGYAFLKTPRPTGPLAYGPEMFDASFEQFIFEVADDGTIVLRLIFVVNKPSRILNVPVVPLEWGLRAADTFSLGLVSPWLERFKVLADRTPARFGSFDPLLFYITAANLMTGGAAARQFCISREQLEKDFLVQHFTQHYRMVAGSLLTWRRAPDWRDAAALPRWVTTGESL